ncbi:uncharacterized protein LOC141618202 [Silene latifolia]|uniref:uncharacterized protein LOC141618202 n=1 Tax=Silene latifolia TaxID=37657 RepID=UPI003D784BA4
MHQECPSVVISPPRLIEAPDPGGSSAISLGLSDANGGLFEGQSQLTAPLTASTAAARLCSVLYKVTSTSLNLTVVYGRNDAAVRNALWAGLQAASTPNPWLVIGDFNVVRCPAEKLGPHPPVLKEMMEFNCCLISCNLDDIAGTSADMTWTNKQDPLTRVWSKLDRALVNQQWISSFPTSNAFYMESGLSDHSLVVVQRVKHALTIFHRENYSDLTGRVKAAKLQIAERKHQQNIVNVADHNGLLHQGVDNVSLAFQNYYTQLLGQTATVHNLDINFIGQGLCVSETDKANLVKDISPSEIRAALFSIVSNRSPGVDGFSSGFFKSSWEIINGDFCAAVYISKILSNRLQPILPYLVGEEQAAFVKGRNIFENIMLSQSLIKGYARKVISPRCLIKVDIRKAFDSIQWEFLSQMLDCLSFPPTFSKWIMGCITNTWYSFKLNGECLLSSKMQQAYLNHIIFADDLMIFVRGDVPSVVAVKETLADFALLSGLHANVDNTNIYLGGVSLEIISAIIHETCFSKGQFPFKYLGIPLSTSTIYVSMFDLLITKIQKSVLHWSSHSLSYAGKLQLLNSVVFGLDNYWCASILLPAAIIKQINHLLVQDRATEENSDSDEAIPGRPRSGKHDNSIKIDFPEFNGSLNPDDFLEWLRSMERIFEFKGYNDSKKFKVAILKLKGYASLWYEGMKNQRLRGGKNL